MVTLTHTRRWFRFEKIVQALVEKKICHVKLEELRTVVKKVCKIDDEEEMMLMLNFYHDLGQIVKHGSTVVLQTQWLIDLFKKVITVPKKPVRFFKGYSEIRFKKKFNFTFLMFSLSDPNTNKFHVDLTIAMFLWVRVPFHEIILQKYYIRSPYLFLASLPGDVIFRNGVLLHTTIKKSSHRRPNTLCIRASTDYVIFRKGE